ncbi:hypothetical protein RND81_14G194700 [Saponaria officinalis]|uniref:HAT C-terminal dimerisation domain-containing protein n=1 Tax=Saponaria officinalis TaxID=3572 RepID=A0AAW1GP22_SAPOF
MVFGRRGTKRRLEADQSEQTQQNPIEVDVEDQQNPIEINKINKTTKNRYLYIPKSLNSLKKWRCNHCQKTHTSSYTKIHHYFFGAPAGQKSDIARCTTMLTNRSKLERIKAMVEEAESNGGSQSLTKSTMANSNVRKSGTQRNVIAESFRTVERRQLDVLVVQALCANGIPFNVLRNPDFINMMVGLSRGSTDYKPPSFDRARTTLVDEVYREVDNKLANVKSTWGTALCLSLGRRVAANINNSDFWDDVDNVIKITKPMYMMIRFADGEGHKMGEVYENMDCMIGEIKDLMSDNKHLLDWEKMEEILVSWWEKVNIPLHCLGFALNPQYYDANYLKTAAPGGHPRRAPNADCEVVNGVLKAFDKIGEDENEKTVLRQQLSAFQAKEGIFGSREVMVDAVIMNPISWWSTYGSETPELAEIAGRVLAQPINSSSAERVWTTYSYIHNTKRNRLNGARADKLVFIHSNIRLISRLTATYKEGPSKKWDINPESDYLEDSIIRLEELRCV